MDSRFKPFLLALLLGLSTLTLAACDDGPAEEAGEEIDDATGN